MLDERAAGHSQSRFTEGWELFVAAAGKQKNSSTKSKLAYTSGDFKTPYVGSAF